MAVLVSAVVELAACGAATYVVMESERHMSIGGYRPGPILFVLLHCVVQILKAVGVASLRGTATWQSLMWSLSMFALIAAQARSDGRQKWAAAYAAVCVALAFAAVVAYASQ
mmetsp:Transcript_41121/g.101155  ORF Transcript_41121/g.101155 Transcript_41121/m.101155 type:complete len:112 (-) Transcript_41121:84-419(-)